MVREISVPLDEDTWCLLLAAASGHIHEDEAAGWLLLSEATVNQWIDEAERCADELIAAMRDEA